MQAEPAIPTESSEKAPPASNAFSISVKMFHEMIDAGILTRQDRCEFIEGELKRKEPRNPPHARLVAVMNEWFVKNLPPEWQLRPQIPVTFSDSEPHPDLAIVRRDADDFGERHPGADEIALLIEVADSSLTYDRVRKLTLYARAGVPFYWIVNLPESQIEVSSQPTVAGKKPKFARRKVYKVDSEVPAIINGVEIARLKLSALFQVKQ